MNIMKIARNNMWLHQQRLDMILDYNIYFEITNYQKTYKLNLSNNELDDIANSEQKVGRYLSMKFNKTMLEWLLE